MELFKILGTIALENGDAIVVLNQTADTAEKTQSRMSKAFTSVGKGAVALGKAVASGVAVGTVAIAGLAKKSLEAYADYEQLVGGVETLFKDASNQLLGFAEEAYKTAGLSANAYMETVTSFSASLIQSLNGDTAKSAEIANKAIIDMSDNANKMGTSMEAIQTAYQGFAKQNYTMLDNLKLGYGGTATEMARLINDSGVLGDKLIDLADTKNIGNALSKVGFAKMIEAIHVVQTKMGITGTTAKEASATIAGSISAMKSSFSNLLAGFGNENADLSALTDQFVETFTTVMHNVMPRLQVILGGMADVIAQVMPIIAENLPALLETLLPPLLEGAVALLNGLVASLPTLLRIVIEQLPFIITEIVKALIAVFPVLLVTVKDLLGQLLDFIGEELFGVSNVSEKAFGAMAVKFNELWGICAEAWNKYGQPIWDSIMVALNWVQENFPAILGVAIIVFQTLIDVISTQWNSLGQPVFDMFMFATTALADLFARNMPSILAFFQSAITGIKDTWENHLKPAFEAIGNFLNNVLKPTFEYVWKNYILALMKNVFAFIGRLWTDTLKPIFDGICDFLTGVFTLNWQLMGEGIMKILTGLWNHVKNMFTYIRTFLSDIWAGIGDDVTRIWEGMWSAIKGFINKIIGGVEGMANGVVGGLNGMIDGINALIGKAGELVGLSVAIPTISSVSLPRLEKGGILEKGQVGLLEGNGAEAVVPLDQNEKWINKVAQDMNGAVGDNALLQKILDVLLDLRDGLPEELTESIASLRFEINNREFARLVKGV